MFKKENKKGECPKTPENNIKNGYLFVKKDKKKSKHAKTEKYVKVSTKM